MEYFLCACLTGNDSSRSQWTNWYIFKVCRRFLWIQTHERGFSLCDQCCFGWPDDLAPRWLTSLCSIIPHQERRAGLILLASFRKVLSKTETTGSILTNLDGRVGTGSWRSQLNFGGDPGITVMHSEISCSATFLLFSKRIMHESWRGRSGSCRIYPFMRLCAFSLLSFPEWTHLLLSGPHVPLVLADLTAPVQCSPCKNK